MQFPQAALSSHGRARAVRAHGTPRDAAAAPALRGAGRRQVFPVTPGQALAAASQQHSGCELLLAHAASQQGEEQMAAYPFTRARLIVSLPYSVYGVHPALLKPRQLEGTKTTSLRGFLHRLTALHSSSQGYNLHAQPAESMQM